MGTEKKNSLAHQKTQSFTKESGNI